MGIEWIEADAGGERCKPSPHSLLTLAPEDRRVQPLGEPAVGRLQEITCRGLLALLPPERGETGCCAELEQLGALAARNCHRLMIHLLGSIRITYATYQIAVQLTQLGFVHSLLGGFDFPLRFPEAIERFGMPAK